MFHVFPLDFDPIYLYLQVINKDLHKSLDEFEFWTDWTIDYGFSYPLASKNQLFSFAFDSILYNLSANKDMQ